VPIDEKQNPGFDSPLPLPAIVYHAAMTQPQSSASFTLEVLPDRLAICRLEPEQADLDWELGDGLLSVTFTDDEVSVVCEEAFAPADAEVSRGWRGLRVVGPLDLGMVGVLAALAGVLAGAGIPIFVLSTFDTDHLLVRDAQLADAISCLRTAGHTVRS
jgi:hypothetical protein